LVDIVAKLIKGKCRVVLSGNSVDLLPIRLRKSQGTT
jgi:hypothetical protein